MACISKLANAIAYDCDSGATGITRAVIINKADIASFVVDPAVMAVSALTLANQPISRIIEAIPEASA